MTGYILVNLRRCCRRRIMKEGGGSVGDDGSLNHGACIKDVLVNIRPCKLLLH
jgi:hypothetical protein